MKSVLFVAVLFTALSSSCFSLFGLSASQEEYVYEADYRARMEETAVQAQYDSMTDEMRMQGVVLEM